MKNILDNIRCRAWGFVPSKLAASDIILCIKPKVCLVGWILKRMKKEKRKKKNRRENEWEGYLVERGKGREKWWGSIIFSLGPLKFNLSKIERKLERKRGRCVSDKIALLHPITNFLSFSTFCFSGFFFFFFCLDKISSCLHSTFTLVWFWFWFWFFWFFILAFAYFINK